MGAERRSTLGGGLEHFEDGGAEQAGAYWARGDTSALAGQSIRSQHDYAFVARQGIAAVNPFLKPHFVYDREFTHIKNENTTPPPRPNRRGAANGRVMGEA